MTAENENSAQFIFFFPNLAGEGDTPSPLIGSPKCVSEVEGSPEINLIRPELPPEQQEEEEAAEDEDPDARDVDRDPTRSEGTIEYRIPEFSKISGKLLSPPIYIRDLPW